ncbi:hypothetical protein [Chryseobacterium gallinarum]|uniref:Uncharacterized protein n=1 Tax=Chryseobacterium gallinarum TaxID=1324352 RepID=A0ABX6KWA4_CHRGL|nr:hypothetical protein [Chryseobacterium gallinarum]QIY92224.1 hypothetical protein FOB44_16830 [Chryseobacterium gallinarum]
MTVKKLKEILEEVDETLEVFISQENIEYNHSICEKAEVKSIVMYDGDTPMCESTVFAISDEI